MTQGAMQKPGMNRTTTISVIGAVICQVILLIVAGWHNRYTIESDAVAFMRIAWYYTTGQFDLAISGYWGPLLSWLMIPWLGLSDNPVDAARIAMGLSAIVFLCGCVSIFRSFHTSTAGIVFGTWIVALASIFWSVELINPDLLMSGLLCLAISRLVSPQWMERRSTQFTTGMLCGVAYLAKAVALPVSFGVGISIGALWVISRMGSLRQVCSSLILTMLGFALIAGPWVLTLSWKYHYPTFSTSAKIAHAVAGPLDVERYHPFRRTFHTPKPGRILSWEEPSDMSYKYWSPLENIQYAKHQLIVIYKNYERILYQLRTFDILGIGVLTLVCGFLLHKPWRENLRTERWRWAGVPVACVSGVYLPVYAADHRYFFPAYPLLIAASVGMVVWLTCEVRGRINVLQLVGVGLVVCSFATPALMKLPRGLQGLEASSVDAYALAKKLEVAGIQGALAGADSKLGLFVAFFMNQPWHGDEQHTTLARLKASRAKLGVINRHSPLIAKLDADSTFENLDSVLFESEEEALKFPLKVYKIGVP